MKKILVYAGFFLISCKSDKNTSATATKDSIGEKEETGLPSVSSGCYRMNVERDSAYMNISINGNSVSGTLDYIGYEKDSNRGNFTGIIDGDKLIGWYTFQSEGMISVRQVIYKIDEGSFLEGYGDIEMSGDTAFFKYPSNLNYELQHPFTKIPCDQ